MPEWEQWRPCVMAARLIAVAALLFLGSMLSYGQDQQPPAQNSAPPQVTTVHGLVRIAASGEPLARALVRINGDAATGVLTDGDGRFEIGDVPEGPQIFQVIKPGFLDHMETGADAVSENPGSYSHNIIVVPQMGDVVFTMEPVNAIQGQVQLSTGDMAQGIEVTLLKRTVQDGRVVWQSQSNAKTNMDGIYRFGELPDGLYAVYTSPAMDSDAATNLVESGSGSKVAREGYPSVFSQDAHDLATAAKIRVAGGEQAQANITLALEPFQPVSAIVTMPGEMRGGAEIVSVQVMDAHGNQLPYTAQYDGGTHTAQAFLPDGAYEFVATSMRNVFDVTMSRGAMTFSGRRRSSQPITGAVSFAVAGRAVSNLKLPLSASASGPVQVTIARSANSSRQTGDTQVYVTLSEVGGWLGDGMVFSYAEGAISTPLPASPPPPGSYWVHTNITPRGLCEGSFTAGGASLAHEPLTLGVGGTTAPLVLSLRDDCAQLTLSMPASVGLAAGEEVSYLVYVVPDFESTQDVVPQTLRPSSGGKITLTGLTPGNYHVFAFDKPKALEYRNPAVLASFPGQSVALAPNAEAELTVEVPQP